MTPQHAPLPWKADDTVCISDANGRIVATVPFWTEFLTAEDCDEIRAHIVRAVNLHQQMIEALKACIESSSSRTGGDCRCGACEKARAVLRKAGALPCSTCKGDPDWTGTADDGVACPECGGGAA